MLPKKTRETAAAGLFVDLYEAYKLTAATAARAQMFAGRRSDAAVTMTAQPDLPTPPLMWKHLMDVLLRLMSASPCWCPTEVF